MLADLQALRRLTALPHLRENIGQSSVDVFGYDQIYAIFNELNFHPRPVFQSYLAYNAALMRLNDKFYLSRAAPEFVLFNLTPIDRRFPPLEDSFVLRDLLINYEPVDAEGAFLLLKSRSHEMPRLNLLREASVSLRQQIDLLEFGQTNLWMEIDAEPTLLGRVRELFYKPSKIRLKVFPGAADSGFPAPAPMLSAGFLASPLVLRRQDLLKAYTGENVSRPEAYSVDPGPDGARFWKPTVRYRIYQIENRIGQHPP
jgi:hypothetical protein